MTWAVPTDVCLPAQASRPDKQRTKRSPQLGRRHHACGVAGTPLVANGSRLPSSAVPHACLWRSAARGGPPLVVAGRLGAVAAHAHRAPPAGARTARVQVPQDAFGVYAALDAIRAGEEELDVFIGGEPGDHPLRRVDDHAGERRGRGENAITAAAREQLLFMRGRTVRFHSGVAVLDGAGGQHIVDCIDTDVTFRQFSEQSIDTYLRLEQPYDCAGSAKIEGLGICLVESVRSDDPTALIGLPLIRLTSMLAALGVVLPLRSVG